MSKWIYCRYRLPSQALRGAAIRSTGQFDRGLDCQGRVSVGESAAVDPPDQPRTNGQRIDVYGEFPINGRRPRPIKSWDTHETVTYCGSATKTIAAGLRVGWLATSPAQIAGAQYQQYVRTVSVQTAGQLALADYLRRGQVDRNLRQMSNAYARARAHLMERIQTFFPTGTRLSRPAGGFVIWLELPEAIDTTEVANDALRAGISFAPRPLFSAGDRFTNCMRLNSAQRWDRTTERALVKLAALLDQ